MALITPFQAFPAPAKLNLTLAITGRRADGYHELQTLFVILDVGDELRIRVDESDAITLEPEVPGVPLEQNRRLVIFPVVAGGGSPRVGSPVCAQGAAEKRPGKYGGRNQLKAGCMPINSQIDPLLFGFIESSSRHIRQVELKLPQAFAKIVEELANRQRTPASERREQASKAAPELFAPHRGGRVRKKDCQPQGGYRRRLQPSIASTAGGHQFSIEPAPADRPADEQSHGLDDLDAAFLGLAAIHHEGAALLVLCPQCELSGVKPPGL